MLEDATYISQLQKNDPGGTDLVSQGDDHLRLIKKVLQNSFEPAIDSALIPDITDKENHLLSVNETADGIIWRSTSETTTGSNYFRYWKSSNQSIVNTSTRIVFDVEKEDPGSQWESSMWTIGVTGIYHIDANARIVEAAIPDHDIMIRINGEAYKQLSYTDYGSGTNKLHSMQISANMMLNAGDVVDIAGKSESQLVLGGSNNSLASVSGYRIR
ncbi:MAG: hypothetical protein HOG25_09765 [Gammaproteobacteria bacterium]|jgi:hypothetical protein|nr:hypothetical protein [Gammaproteobacteria bacterium]